MKKMSMILCVYRNNHYLCHKIECINNNEREFLYTAF